VRAMAEPQSYPEILEFRDRMAEKGSRLTSVTDLQKSHSESEHLNIAGLDYLNFPEDRGSATSSSDLTREAPSSQSQTRLDPSVWHKIIGIAPESYIDDPNDSPEINSGSGKDSSTNTTSEVIELDDLEQPTKQGKGKIRAVSRPKETSTLVLRDHPPKRPFDQSDLETASSSAGPSKRPRQENQSQFSSDYLDEEELNFLLENGGFAE
jgi:hypothetical protein